MSPVDRAIVETLYGIVGVHAVLRSSAVFFGHWSGYVIAPTFILWALWVWRRSRKPAFLLQATLASLSSRIVLELIRLAWDIKRPFLALGIQPLFQPFENGPSFPSGHATFYFALAAVAWNQSKKASVALFAAALLMGIGRIAAGVHWPSDVIAGAILGIAAGYFSRRIISS